MAEKMESRFDQMDTRFDVFAQSLDHLSRDVGNQRPPSPYRPTSSLSNVSSWTQDSYRPPSRASTYAGGNTSFRPIAPKTKNIHWVPLSETYGNSKNLFGPKASTPQVPRFGGRNGDSNKQGGDKEPRPPPAHYTGGYKGKNFDELRWAKDLVAREERLKAKQQNGDQGGPDSKVNGKSNSQGGTRAQTSGPP